ncbi:MAG: hypothetical protein ACRCY9_12910 [Phycicoccus sp.]
MAATDPAQTAVTTYRYIRIAIVALLALLGVSVFLEWWATGRECVQGSISEYIYTPVDSVFVGVLVAVGICLIALKGSTPGEDVLLNIAGMLAPAVAFVPTQPVGECRSVPLVRSDIPSSVANNVEALLVVGVAVAVVVIVVALREAGAAGLRRADRIGVLVAVGMIGAGAVWFFADRESFLVQAHEAAAVPMFVAIVAVVWLNARDVERTMSSTPTARRYVRIYRAIAGLMLVGLGIVVGVSLATQSTSLVFWVEVVLLVLVAVFWTVETVELWHAGLRRA